MRSFVKACRKLGIWMNAVSGSAIFFIMLLTVADIVLRFFSKAVPGTYEITSIAGAIVIGYAIPKTSFDRGHIYVDLLLEKCSGKVRNTVFVLTRIPSIAFFSALTWFLVDKGYGLYESGEVSLVLRLPRYPLAYALAACCLMECLVLVTDILRVFDDGETK